MTGRLWGNPSHLEYLQRSLNEKFEGEDLHILVTKTNASNLTYDGIDVGAERVVQEIEETIKMIESRGVPIAKFSIIGYSLGGLVARYAVGLLYSRGLFDRIQPVNFHTFACPHLGVKTPLQGPHSRAWNMFGGNTLSTSGRQLFLIDSFRDSKQPLLSIMTKPNSIFLKALSSFNNLVLYANVINDRSSPYYTSAFSKTDPFADPDLVKIEYLEGYEPVIVKSPSAVSKNLSRNDTFPSNLIRSSKNFFSTLPWIAALTIITPFALTAFVVNAGIQHIRSNQRIRLHESNISDNGFGIYRIPLMLEHAATAAGGQSNQIGTINGEQSSNKEPSRSKDADNEMEKYGKSAQSHSRLLSQFENLALAPEQFEMIENLDRVGFKKFPVFIHKVRHTHAAIIVRSERRWGFDEGRLIVKHWLDEVFQL